MDYESATIALLRGRYHEAAFPDPLLDEREIARFAARLREAGGDWPALPSRAAAALGVQIQRSARLPDGSCGAAACPDVAWVELRSNARLQALSDWWGLVMAMVSRERLTVTQADVALVTVETIIPRSRARELTCAEALAEQKAAPGWLLTAAVKAAHLRAHSGIYRAVG